MEASCIFCAIAAGDAPAMIVAQDERTIAFMDIAPATRGHMLVIPRAHSEDLLSIPPEDLDAVMHTAQRLTVRAKDRLDADGVNVLNSCGAAAWQTVFHFHVHVIPRYVDDPLRLPWRPESGDMEEIKRAGEELADA
jgi:histidine triad (HIT) family protein